MLLTGIVVIAMTMLLAWATWYATSHPSKWAVRERFVIEHIWYNRTGNVISYMGFWIYNFGEVPITIDKVFINDVDVTADVVAGESKLSYLPGEDGKIVVDLSGYNWGSGVYWIRVVTARGSYTQARTVVVIG